MPWLSAEGLHASHGAVVALDGIDLRVEAGETVALLGRNGAGKTTLLRCLAGLHAPGAGRVLLGGTDLTRLPAAERVRRGLAMVPEGGGVFSGLRVEETLLVAARPAPVAAARLEEVCRRLPLVRELRRRVVGTLSGGERRQVAVARALMSGPSVLLVDELSLGLSPHALSGLVEVLRGVAAAGTALLVVEQRVDVALRLAGRALVLERGRVVMAGSGPELASAGAGLRRAYLGDESAGGAAAEPSSTGFLEEERLSLPLSNPLRRRLQEAADSRGLSAGAYVARLVEEHLAARSGAGRPA